MEPHITGYYRTPELAEHKGSLKLDAIAGERSSLGFETSQRGQWLGLLGLTTALLSPAALAHSRMLTVSKSVGVISPRFEIMAP